MEAVLPAQFLRKLDRLRLVPRRTLASAQSGEHRSAKRGQSVEFADYREYLPGDDYRYIDWNIYSRLDRLFVKLFIAEESLRLDLLIDASRSMGFGSPSKLAYAAQVAAALGYIALKNGESTRLATFAQGLSGRSPALTGREQLGRLLRYAGGLEAAGTTTLGASLQNYAVTQSGPGIAVVLSDLLDPEGWESGVAALLTQGRRVALVHILTPEEVEPEATGQFSWVDSERGSRVELTCDPVALALYRETLAAWAADISAFCRRRRIDYFPITTRLPLEELFLTHLRRGGLLR